MSRQQQIRDGLAALARRHGPIQTMLATVVSVDEDEETCVVDDGDGFHIGDVRLRPVITGNRSYTIFPKVGTWVLLTRIEEDEAWMVLSADEIDKYRIEAGTNSLKHVITLIIQATQQIVVMQGNNPDYVKLQQALTELNQLLK